MQDLYSNDVQAAAVLARDAEAVDPRDEYEFDPRDLEPPRHPVEPLSDDLIRTLCEIGGVDFTEPTIHPF